jgi:hypothetical protein
MPYVVADEVFSTKEEITNRARAILRRTQDGHPVEDADTEFLVSLFQHHDEWHLKSVGGVSQITTQTTVHGTRCFVLRKHDNSVIDISFPHSVRLIPSTRSADLLPQKLQDFRSAGRSAVRPQIFAFRDKALLKCFQCPISGETVNRHNAAVDHEPPRTFDALLFNFCQKNRINPLEVDVGSEEGVVAVFEDSDLLRRWQDFHEAEAKLRLVSRLGNLRLPKLKIAWAELWT